MTILSTLESAALDGTIRKMQNLEQAFSTGDSRTTCGTSEPENNKESNKKLCSIWPGTQLGF